MNLRILSIVYRLWSFFLSFLQKRTGKISNSSRSKKW